MPRVRHLRCPHLAAVAAFAALAAALVVAAPPAAEAAAPAATFAPSPSAAKAPAKPKSMHAARRRAARPLARKASCYAPMVGDWRNIDLNTRAMTRALVTFTCNDVILCDTNGNCTGGDSYYSMQMFGKCHPTDCNWGRLRAYPQYDGWIRSIYSFGFKASHVWLKTYSFYGLTYLRVWVHNDFAPSDGRADYTTDEWFLR